MSIGVRTREYFAVMMFYHLIGDDGAEGVSSSRVEEIGVRRRMCGLPPMKEGISARIELYIIGAQRATALSIKSSSKRGARGIVAPGDRHSLSKPA